MIVHRLFLFQIKLKGIGQQNKKQKWNATLSIKMIHRTENVLRFDTKNSLWSSQVSGGGNGTEGLWRKPEGERDSRWEWKTLAED